MSIPSSIVGEQNSKGSRPSLKSRSRSSRRCGFTAYVPSRPTLSRVFCQIKELHGLLEGCLSEITESLSDYLPDLGREVAVDSTMVKTNSNTKREPLSDAEATWGKQHSAQESKGWRWVFGYKAHVVADANYDVPLALIVTTGSESDTKYLVPLVKDLQWRPEVVIADRGYDWKYNSEWLHRRGIAPVIHKRRSKSGDYTGENGQSYSERGTPLCPCGHERPFVGTDPYTGVRVYGPVSDCERVFSKWKGRKVLESHSFRELSTMRLLIMLYALMVSAKKLAKARLEEAFPVAA